MRYPVRPIRLLTGAPGGGVDFATRLIAAGLSHRLRQTINVENLPAGAMAEVLCTASPDGYTLLITGKILWLTPFMRPHATYDPLGDFAPISLLVTSPNILVVNPELPLNSVGDLIELARARPGQLKFTSSGSGASTHLAGELFKVMAGVDLVHTPVKGNVLAIQKVVDGDAQVMFSAITAAQSHIASGRLRALAVTGNAPSPHFPSLPTVAQSGLAGYQSASVLGMFAPANTPAPVLTMLNEHVVSLIRSNETRAKLMAAGLQAMGTTASELTSTMRFEMDRLGAIIRQLGIRAES